MERFEEFIIFLEDHNAYYPFLAAIEANGYHKSKAGLRKCLKESNDRHKDWIVDAFTWSYNEQYITEDGWQKLHNKWVDVCENKIKRQYKPKNNIKMRLK
jgi:hypothetical protein